MFTATRSSRAPTVLWYGFVSLLAGCFHGDRLLAVMDDAGVVADAGPTLPVWMPFGSATMVVGTRTDLDDVQDPSLTADELDIFFTSPTGGINDIWTSHRDTADAAWGTSVLVTELSSSGVDEDPTVSADGLTIYLATDRAGAGMRLYVAHRSARDQAWMAPRSLGDLGTSSADQAPTLDVGATQMVFASQRGAATDLHLYATSRSGTNDTVDLWRAPVALAAATSAWQDRDPALYDQARGLVFASRRTGQGQTSDLFHTYRASGDTEFVATPQRIDELSTSSWEGDPWLSEDGRHIYFVSDRDGRSRIYEARR